MEKLTINEAIPSRDLYLAVTEPDVGGCRFYVARVRHHHCSRKLCTEITYLPLPDIPAPRLTVDVDGSAWVDPSTVECDEDGYARLVWVHA